MSFFCESLQPFPPSLSSVMQKFLTKTFFKKSHEKKNWKNLFFRPRRGFTYWSKQYLRHKAVNHKSLIYSNGYFVLMIYWMILLSTIQHSNAYLTIFRWFPHFFYLINIFMLTLMHHNVQNFFSSTLHLLKDSLLCLFYFHSRVV